MLKFSHTDQPGGARNAAALLFAKSVESYTQGRYKVQVYPAGQLANDPKAVEQLQLGGIDFTVTGTGTYATHIPTLNLTALPFIMARRASRKEPIIVFGPIVPPGCISRKQSGGERGTLISANKR